MIISSVTPGLFSVGGVGTVLENIIGAQPMSETNSGDVNALDLPSLSVRATPRFDVRRSDNRGMTRRHSC
jgi:hypothetical protein